MPAVGSARRRRRLRSCRGAAFALAALSGGAAVEPRPAVAAETVHVRSSIEFQHAVASFRESGGEIVLRGGRYEHIFVGPRGSARLTVRGTRNASVGRLTMGPTRSVTVIGLRFTPSYQDAGITVTDAQNIRFERIVVTGRDTGFKSNLLLNNATGVTIERSRFSRCGDRAVCVLTGWSTGVRILRSTFVDCFGCDFIRGNFRRNLVIRENTFDRALVGPCGTDNALCNHQEMIELHAGERLFIERNRFGVYEPPGAGQVALFGPIHDVRIRDNLFLRTDPRAPGEVSRVAINLGGRAAHPKRVVIAHNTILAGRPHWRGFANSIRLKPSIVFMPLEDRPVIANNIIRLARTPRFFCRNVRLSTGNLIADGEPCSRDDAVGSPRLSPSMRLTDESTNAIGLGDPEWATRLDLRGVPRQSPPAAGAFEYVPPRPR